MTNTTVPTNTSEQIKEVNENVTTVPTNKTKILFVSMKKKPNILKTICEKIGVSLTTDDIKVIPDKFTSVKYFKAYEKLYFTGQLYNAFVNKTKIKIYLKKQGASIPGKCVEFSQTKLEQYIESQNSGYVTFDDLINSYINKTFIIDDFYSTELSPKITCWLDDHKDLSNYLKKMGQNQTFGAMTDIVLGKMDIVKDYIHMHLLNNLSVQMISMFEDTENYLMQKTIKGEKWVPPKKKKEKKKVQHEKEKIKTDEMEAKATTSVKAEPVPTPTNDNETNQKPVEDPVQEKILEINDDVPPVSDEQLKLLNSL